MLKCQEAEFQCFQFQDSIILRFQSESMEFRGHNICLHAIADKACIPSSDSKNKIWYGN